MDQDQSIIADAATEAYDPGEVPLQDIRKIFTCKEKENVHLIHSGYTNTRGLRLGVEK
jgi:hypothetical protein